MLQASLEKPEEIEGRKDLHNTPSISMPHRSGRIPRLPDRYYKDVLMHPL